MQTDNRFIDDLARLAGGALHSAGAVREEIEARLRHRLEALLGGMNLVARDEFEAVKAMAAKARAENEALAERVARLEAAPASKPVRRARARAK
ncbi:MAG: accessory factor UbiK family protein [Alphaproteobacteria bacterium]